ncbi:hypothetical protein B0H13DRAFT_1878879 [Mycena leptocephala]|nr:hypothetical protein B0H13DRAFT_1878879 [Mycena leptocephala]
MATFTAVVTLACISSTLAKGALSGAGLCTDVKPGYISDAGLLSYSGDRGVHVCTDERQTVLTVIPTSNNMYIDAAQDIENHRDLFTFRWVHDGALRTMFVENPPVPGQAPRTFIQGPSNAHRTEANTIYRFHVQAEVYQTAPFGFLIFPHTICVSVQTNICVCTDPTTGTVKLRHISPDNNDLTCRWIFNVETPPANFTDAAYAQEVAAQNSDGARTKKDD